jgi:hypothetical protein
MHLRDFLLQVANNYDRHAGMSAPAQVLLRHAHEELAEVVPAGLVVRGRGGQTKPTLTPFIAFLDPDETTRPTEGVYVVYIFTEDLRDIVLTLNQGITGLADQMGHAAARGRLADDANAIREALPDGSLSGLDALVSLRSSGTRQRGYEAGNIAAIKYDSAILPNDDELITDLRRMLELYQEAVAAKRRLLQATPGAVASSSFLQTTGVVDPLVDFRPKDDSDYVAHVEGRELTKTRRHEAVVRQFGEFAAARGLVPSTTEHPRDLVLRREGEEWLVEVKVVYRGNATEAVRAALGQLYTYRHFLYVQPTDVRLLAVFSEPIGGAYAEFLESCAVASVWKANDGWNGSPRAVVGGLVDG